MNYRSSQYVSFVLLFVGLSLPVFADDQNSDLVDWETASPDLIHQRLHDSKVAGRLNQKFVRSALDLDAKADAMDDYDVLFYDVEIRVNDTTEVLWGRVTFQIKALTSLSEIEFDFYRYMAIDSVKSGGALIVLDRDFDIAIVEPATPLTVDEIYSFDVFFRGHPPEGGFQAFSFGERNGYKVMSSLSEPYFARTWWPCKDRMTDKPDSMNIAIEVDTTYYVGSNGTLDSIVQMSDNTHMFHYRVRYPIVTYLFSVTISVYTVWEQTYNYDGGSMPIVHLVYPDRYTYSLPRWGLMPDIFDALTPYYGPYPFLNEKYGHANFQWGGGMEHQTLTSMTGSNFGFATQVVVHEVGHQWWGNMITCASWHDIWLNEGWASYTEALYYQVTSGWSTYRSYMNSMAYTGGGTIYVADTSSLGSIFHGGLSYDKGAWVCHMLRGLLGDTLFFNGIDDYYHSEFQHGAATTEDFKNVFEASTGLELDWFFDDWIHGTYRPNYHWAWMTEQQPDLSYDLYLIVEQTQASNPKVFSMPVPFYVDFSGGSNDTLVFKCDAARKLFKTNVPNNVNSMTLDPADWVLKYQVQDAWGVRIISGSGDLSEAMAFETYVDTLFAIGGSGVYDFAIVGGSSLPAGLLIDNNGIISGTPVEADTLTFTLRVTDNSIAAFDELDFTIIVGGCCGTFTAGYTGNVNCDTAGKRNLADITGLIDHVYISKAPLCCTSNGNTDGDFAFKVNLADISRLIDHVYLSKSETAACL